MNDDTYKETRADLSKTLDEQTKFLDQTNLTLAGGALGLSLTFMHDFVTKPADPGLLSAGWASLLASIVLTLASVHTSQIAINKYIRNLDNAADKGFTVKSLEFLNGRWVNLSAAITAYLNVLSSLTLIAGIALVALFAYNNLQSPKEHAVEKQIPSPGEIIKRGAVPIAPIVPAQPPAAPAQENQSQEGTKK